MRGGRVRLIFITALVLALGLVVVSTLFTGRLERAAGFRTNVTQEVASVADRALKGTEVNIESIAKLGDLTGLGTDMVSMLLGERTRAVSDQAERVEQVAALSTERAGQSRP